MTAKKRTSKIVLELEKEFGVPEGKNRLDPLSNLILTILSQNTNDRNRDAAYLKLKERFSTWQDVMRGDVKQIEKAIQCGGLAKQKSERIQNILNWINCEYGSLNLDSICDEKPDEIIEKFTKLKGIGIKTISVVLMFSCGVDIFPVDTHVHRICRRLGLVANNTTAEKTFYLMKSQVPKNKSYSLHMNLLKLGRTICLARNPKCDKCPINHLCNFHNHHNHSTVK